MAIEDIRHFIRIDERVATAGQPTESQLREVAAAGYEAVANLGLLDPKYCLPDEAGLAASLGLTYSHIPVQFDGADTRRLSEVRSGNGRVVHQARARPLRGQLPRIRFHGAVRRNAARLDTRRSGRSDSKGVGTEPHVADVSRSLPSNARERCWREAFDDGRARRGIGLDPSVPRDEGVLELIVRRPRINAREILTEGVLDPLEGLVGDTWRARGSSRTPGHAASDLQLNIMNARAIALVAQDKARWPGWRSIVSRSGLERDESPSGTNLRSARPSSR